jgi:hypothetical protein
LLVQSLYPTGIDQLCGDVLKALGGFKFAPSPRLVGLFHFASLLSPAQVRI